MENLTGKSILRCSTIVSLALCSAISGSRFAHGEPPALLARETMQGGTLVFSPDSRLAVTANLDKAVLWEVRTLRKLRTFVGHTSAITSAAFAVKGTRVVTTSRDGTVRLWDVKTGRQVHRFTGHGEVAPNAADRWAGTAMDDNRQVVLAATVSAGGRYLITGGADHTARIWDTITGRQVRQFHETQDGDIACLRISADNRLLLTGGCGSRSHGAGTMGAVQIWDVQTGRALRRLEHAGLQTFEISPDGKSAVTASHKQALRWNIATGEVLQKIDYRRGFAISPDTRFLLTGTSDGDVCAILWSLDSGRQVRRFTGHDERVRFFGFSPDSRLTVMQTESDLRLWDTNSGRQRHRFELPSEIRQHRLTKGRVRPAVSPDGKVLVFQSNKRTTAWDTTTGKQIARLDEPAMRVSDIAHASNGNFVIVNDGTAWVWSASGKPQISISGKAIRTVAFSQGGDYLLTDGSGDKLQLWNAQTGQRSKEFVGHERYIDCVAISPDMTLAASCAEDFRIWEVGSGRLLHRIDIVADRVVFAPDGRHLITTGEKSGVRLWEASTGREVHRFLDESEGRIDAVFFPDGRTIITSRPAPIVWSVANGQPLRYIGHTPGSNPQPASCLAVSHDGKTVFTSVFDGDQQRWLGRLCSAATGQETLRLMGNLALLQKASFSPDGQHLMTLNIHQVVQLWATETGEEVCRLHAFGGSGWSVVTPEGRFDSNDLDRVDHHHWVLPDDPLQPLPIEIFMRDYYEPDLLSKVITGRKLPPIRDISELNRVQPQVKIVKVESQDEAGETVNVTVAVANVKREYDGKVRESGMHDLHLFRDGQLVGFRSLEGSRDLATKTFENVRLPRTGGGQVEFTAYAFNVHGVKSETTTPVVHPFKLPSRKGRVYVVSVGVDQFEEHPSATFGNLRYAVHDATEFASLLPDSFRGLQQFDEVVPVTLVSASKTNRETSSARSTATKQHIKAVFDLLAGRSADTQIKAQIPNADRIEPARPEDAVIISFSTHGYTRSSDTREARLGGREGEFYLVPSDIGDQQGGKVLDRCLSAEQLSLWLRDVDAGEMVMIIDACQSTGSTGAGFKPGPMGSRGLGQLAYNKRMRILAASQAAAQEVGGMIGHGLLSYALLKEGLQQSRADFQPSDSKITIGEWLRFGERQVPIVAQRVQRGELRIAVRGITSLDKRNAPEAQQPVLFDFTKGRDGVVIKEVQATTARKNH